MTMLRICFVGDSIINGTLDQNGQGWPGRLVAAEIGRGHHITLYNLGVRAETSKDVARRWKGECVPRLPAEHPGAIVLGFGVNDMVEEPETGVRVPVDDSVAVAEKIVTEASDFRPTIWVGPSSADMGQQPFSPGPGISYSFDNARTAELNQGYANLARELEVPYLDLFTPLSQSDRWAAALEAGDGVHPGADGYALIAEIVGEWRYWRAWLD